MKLDSSNSTDSDNEGSSKHAAALIEFDWESSGIAFAVRSLHDTALVTLQLGNVILRRD